MTLATTLATVFRLFKADGLKLVLIALALHIPGTAVQVAACFLKDPLLTLAHSALALAATLLTIGATLKIASERYEGRSVTAPQALQAAFASFFGLLRAMLLAGLRIIVGFVCLIGPGVYLTFALSLTYPALMLEGLGPAQACSRSRQLAAGRWSRVFGVLAALWVPVLLVGGALATAMLAAAACVTTAPMLLMHPLIKLGIAVVHPVIQIGKVVLYYDCRAHLEASSGSPPG